MGCSAQTQGRRPDGYWGQLLLHHLTKVDTRDPWQLRMGDLIRARIEGDHATADAILKDLLAVATEPHRLTGNREAYCKANNILILTFAEDVTAWPMAYAADSGEPATCEGSKA